MVGSRRSRGSKGGALATSGWRWRGSSAGSGRLTILGARFRRVNADVDKVAHVVGGVHQADDGSTSMNSTPAVSNWVRFAKMDWNDVLLPHGCRKSTLDTFHYSVIRGRRQGCRAISSPHASSASASQQCLGELHCRQNAGLTAWPAAYRSSALDCCAGSYGAAHHPNRESSRINPSPQRKDVRE
jgi:hypothetical protein